ncbi:hypothetical protein IQ07DRAFT_77359 [Pyrenochaeta sp. DS3sAY3a]|nr:hypothetical protein IQ07DRAFT_77359 [Pyrenochaeta sp. DS3sAY3a]
MPTSTHKAARLLTDPFPSLAESDGQHEPRAAIPSNGSLTLYTSPAPGCVHVETQDDLETIDGEDARSPSPKLDHGKHAKTPPPYNFRPRYRPQLTEERRQQVQERFGHAVPLISELSGPSFTHDNASCKATLKRNRGQPKNVHEAEHGSGSAEEHSKPVPEASLKLKLKLRNPEPKHPKLFIRIKVCPYKLHVLSAEKLRALENETEANYCAAPPAQ